MKRGRTADFSHQVYLIEQLHISLSCHCVRIKAVTQSFLLPDNIKAICVVYWNVRSTGEEKQKLESVRTTAMSMNGTNKRQGEGAAMAAYGQKRKIRGERERRQWGDEETSTGVKL